MTLDKHYSRIFLRVIGRWNGDHLESGCKRKKSPVLPTFYVAILVWTDDIVRNVIYLTLSHSLRPIFLKKHNRFTNPHQRSSTGVQLIYSTTNWGE